MKTFKISTLSFYFHSPRVTTQIHSILKSKIKGKIQHNSTDRWLAIRQEKIFHTSMIVSFFICGPSWDF